MAKIEIQSAFVEPWTKNQDAHPAWGMKTAEPHSRKREDGSRETVSRTYRTVKVSRSSGIDLTVFGKGDRVKIVGSEVTEVREHEGKKYYDVIVWADSVERIESSQAPQGGFNGGSQPAGMSGWGAPQNTPQGNPDGSGFGSGFDENPF